MYKSPEHTPWMRQYRREMSDCIKLPRCFPVAPANYSPDDGGAMMGAHNASHLMGRGGGGGRGGGHGGHGGRGHGGRGGRGRGFGGGGWGGPWFGPWDGPFYYEGQLLNPCDVDPYSYECFLASGGGRRLASQSMILGKDFNIGNGTDFYSRVQAANFFPRMRRY